jgi:hypothetical protein
MAATLTQHGRVQRPNWRKILAEKVREMMRANPSLGSHAKLAVAASRHSTRKIGASTIRHLLNHDDGPQPQLDTIVAVADAFKVQPWELLVPNDAPAGAAAAEPEARYLALPKDAAAISDLHQLAVDLVSGLRALNEGLPDKSVPAPRPTEILVDQSGALSHRRSRKRRVSRN